MKKIITTTLLAGSLMSMFGVSALLADESQTQTIDKKARAILFGKVKSNHEAQEAIQIALSTKGVWAVKSFFMIEK